MTHFCLKVLLETELIDTTSIWWWSATVWAWIRLRGSEYIWSTMGSLVAHGQEFNLCESPAANKKLFPNYSQMESSYPQRIARIGSNIPMVCTVVHLGGVAKGSKQHLLCHWHFQHHWTRWILWPQRQSSLDGSPGSCCGPHSKPADFQVFQ